MPEPSSAKKIVTFAFEWAEEQVGRNDPTISWYCILCGKRVAPNNRYSVHVINGGGELLSIPDEEHYVSDAGDMLMFQVGPECRRKIPPEYVHVRDAKR
ncbi:MAG TPA: hypothetical protein PKJ00_11285 [Verrucomicrobiota bacterium]|nr:hypothetical protein [Verrucomicrobiota bacterium]HNS69505.1 hypothetical protein [Verrucomicrobiota bacterium]